MRSVLRAHPCAKNAQGWGTHGVGCASEIKSLGHPPGVRVSPDGQTVWVACQDSSHQLVPFETALVNTTQFAAVTPITTASSTDAPIGIAFRPDGAFGLATLSAGSPNSVLPFTTTAGTPVATTGVTTPYGIDHIQNGVLHMVTSALPAATPIVPYASSIVANGPNNCLLYTSPSPRDGATSRMPSSA